MPTKNQEGSTTTDGTEQTLFTVTTSNTYVFVIDTANMVNGDIIEVRAKTKVTTGDTSQEAYHVTYAHLQAQPNKYSVPIPIDIEIVVTLERVGGSDRTYIWSLLELE